MIIIVSIFIILAGPLLLATILHFLIKQQKDVKKRDGEIEYTAPKRPFYIHAWSDIEKYNDNFTAGLKINATWVRYYTKDFYIEPQAAGVDLSFDRPIGANVLELFFLGKCNKEQPWYHADHIVVNIDPNTKSIGVHIKSCGRNNFNIGLDLKRTTY